MVTMTKTPAITSPRSDVLTTPLPGHTDSIVIAVVIFFVLLTLVCLSFLLYRYMCRDRGEYRTTGEPAAGEDPEEIDFEKEPEAKKEYFI